MRWIPIVAVAATLIACEEREPGPEDMGPGQETAETSIPGGAVGDGPDAGSVRGAEGVGDTAFDAETTIGGPPTSARSAEGTGAPAPPGGYAVDSRPVEGGRMARIEYASPRTVAEVARFYDDLIEPASRAEVDIAGDNLVAYGLSQSTTVDASTTAQDIERLLDSRSEPVVVISPWRMQRDDPLIRDLRSAGQDAQADGLLNTRSKVTVVYAIR